MYSNPQHPLNWPVYKQDIDALKPVFIRERNGLLERSQLSSSLHKDVICSKKLKALPIWLFTKALIGIEQLKNLIIELQSSNQ